MHLISVRRNYNEMTMSNHFSLSHDADELEIIYKIFHKHELLVPSPLWKARKQKGFIHIVLLSNPELSRGKIFIGAALTKHTALKSACLDMIENIQKHNELRSKNATRPKER